MAIHQDHIATTHLLHPVSLPRQILVDPDQGTSN